MNPHLKKFISYLVLALIVYVLIYFVLLTYMRMISHDVSNFCEQLEKGMPLLAIQSKARAEGLSVATSKMKDNKASLLFIGSPGDSSATCQAHIIDGELNDKKFILSVF